MKLVIDNREKDLYAEIGLAIAQNDKFKSINYEYSPLEIGDMIIRDDDNRDILIYERKTIQDLVASIKDGRYDEQSYRLGGMDLDNYNIVYLFEGTVSAKSKDRNMIFSAMFSLNYYKGFSTMRTTNVAETAFVLCNTVVKLVKETSRVAYTNKSNKSNVDNDEEAVVSYASVIKKNKKENITVDNFGEIVLCQIPNVSSVTAQAVMCIYKNIHALDTALREDEHCLDNVTYVSSKNQTRKLSKLCVSNIIKFIRT